MRKLALLSILGFTFVSNVEASCFERAATTYGVEESLLRAIAQVESRGNAEVIATNRHGGGVVTYDIGLMQINSTWLKHGLFKKLGYQKEHLLDPCVNVMVGAWVLASNFKDYGANWEAVGAYNASCTSMTKEECKRVRNQYAWRVYKTYKQITNRS